MRYEDASHTGEFQGQGPIANDDLELVAAGQKSSATGNLITGEGTQSGAAGADSAAGAHITSIAGKGGEDSSFAGGKLSVMGDYGKLSVDADGNYIYQVNKGVENVRDRFTYTLADGEGASDSAALIVEIGKTPLVIQANAQQIVPGPDGVVTLPPGVELSDVHVVGRNLVIDMPDGTQLIIVDGAVFVPQLVLGGVEVPATNVAALLVGQEIQPAAGETPPSSGGNFAVPPPPLDPGVPLGDLIPPTEYDYIPPEPQPTFAIEDDEPEAGVANVILDDDVVVEEGNRPDGPGDEGPDVLGQNVASGNLPGSEGDGALTWGLLASGVLPAGFSFAAQLNGDIWIMQGADHVLTVHVTPATGAFTVTQLLPLDHPAGGDENNLNFTINYSVTDEDGDTAVGQLNINVDDDTPTVNVQAGPDAQVVLTTDDADTDGTPTDSDTASTTANFSGVFSGTTVSFGADGAGPGTSSTYTLAVTGQNSGLTSHGATINLFVVSGVVVGTTAGSAGAINAGNTIFTVSTTNTGIVTLTQFQQIDHPIAQDPTATTAPFNDQFVSMVDGLVTLTRAETVVDGDGDQVTGSATVSIGANLHFTDDGPSISQADRSQPTLNVDESDFATNDSESFAENFSAVFGADGPANGGGITYSLGVLSANVASGLIDSLTNQAVVLNVVNGQVVGTAGIGGPVVFTVSVNAAGVVTLDQSRAVIHSPDSGPDQTTTLSADNLVTLTATATDFDGDTDSETINIGTNLTFDDDAPSATVVTTGQNVSVDETAGVQGDSNDTTNAGVIALFAGVADVGVDPDMSPQYGNNAGAIVAATGSSFGADGAGTTVFSLAVSAPGVDSGLDTTEGFDILLFKEGNLIVGRVDGGAHDGEAAFAIAIDPATGAISMVEYLSIDHPVNPNPDDSLSINNSAVQAVVTVTDKDGDSDTDSINIGSHIQFQDDGPTAAVVTTGQTVSVDETPGVQGDSNDTTNAGVIALFAGVANKGVDPDMPAQFGQNGSAIVAATGSAYGADGAGTTVFSLAVSSPGVDSGLDTTDGQSIFLFKEGDLIVGRVGDASGPAAFAIAINSSTGVVSMVEYLSLDHPANPNPDDVLAIANNAIQAVVTVTDGDGDPATNSVGIGGQIQFQDDGPSANPDTDTTDPITDQASGNVITGVGTNEGSGNADDPGADAFGSITNLVGFNGSADGDATGGFDVNGEWGTLHMDANGQYTYTRTGGAGGATDTFTYTYVDGDGDPASTTLIITLADNTPNLPDPDLVRLDDDVIPGANGILNGPGDDDPDTVPGNVVNGQLAGTGGDGALTYSFTGTNTLPSGFTIGAGSDADTLLINQNGSLVMTIQLNLATGAFTVTQNAPMAHPADNGGPDDNIENNFTFSIGVQVKDIDNDTDTATITINVDDDSPTATVVATGANVSVDETNGNQGDSNDVTGPLAVFNGVANKGTDADMAGPQFGLSAGAIVASTGSAYGADGAGTTVFGLSVAPGGVDSGLDTTAGVSIFLFLESGIVVGRVGATAGAAAAGPAAFAISIDPATGVISMVQYMSLDHPTNPNPDESMSILNSALQATVTVTDGDGDPATSSIDIGSHVQFQDDGPTAAVVATGSDVSVDETNGNQGDSNDVTGPLAVFNGVANKGTDADMAGPQFGLSASAIVASTGSAYGADGAGTTVFGLSVTPGGVDSGLDTTAGVNIFLFLESGIVVGRVGATAGAAAAGPAAFAISIDPATGVISMVQYMSLDHPTNPNPDESMSILNSALQATVTVTDGDGDPATSSIDIGSHVQFQDDGPTAAIVTTGQTVSLDESAGNQVDSNDVTGPLAVFAGVANVGDDLDVAGTGPIQFATNASALVASTGSAYGADGAGTTLFSLSVAPGGVDSGLDTTAGVNIFLFLENGIVVGRVGATAGVAAAGPAAFALAINPTTGAVSMVEYLSINHPNAGNPDDSVSILNTAVQATVTVTDGDGDTATQSVNIGSLISFQDSGPIMTSVQNMNIQNSGDVAHTAAFAFNLGADGANTSNDVITNVTGSATVAGVAVTNYAISQTSEDANTAVFTFSFDYPIGGGATAHATGTLTFNKLAGTYTVDLANPIQGVTTILQTATGTLFQGYEFGTSTPDGSQPEISVTQIQDLAGTANDIYVQFTSVAEPSSGTGNNALEVTNWVPGADNPPPIDAPPNPDASDFSWSAGQVFNQEDSWVSTSNDSNGVAGDTIQGGEVLDFNLVKGANPTGTLANPANYAQASAMFLKFDGIGEGEDMIIILKLFDTNTLTYTTKALMVQNGDIQKGPGSGPGIFSGITLDQNDGLIIIEPNDYQQGNTNLVIVGAQIAGSDEGVSGTAIDFTYGGTLGVASTGTQSFDTDVGDGPMKISSIGFVSVQTTPQNAQLDFNVTITDGDGDSITQAIQATVTAAADSTSAATIPAANTTVAPVVLDLNGDGVQFLAADAGVRFDYNGDGVKEATAWAGPSDGILIQDANGNGTVDGASEFVFGSNGATDLEGLAAEYGATLDANDADFAQFGVWQDANSNGVVDAGEYGTLTATGITSISLVSDGNAYSAAGGDVEVAGSSTYTRADGSTGVVADASFHVGRTADDGRELGSTSSTIAIAAAVAAAGLAANQAAASPPDAADHGQETAAAASASGTSVAAVASDEGSDVSRSALSNETKVVANDDAPASSSLGAADGESHHALDDSNASEADSSSAAPAGEDHGPAAAAAAASPAASAVAMVSAEALQAAGLDGNAQHTGAVEKVIAEALGQGNGHSAIDALLDAFQGGNGGGAAIANLASSNANFVSAWDMASGGGSNIAHEMLMKVGAQIHHDMVPPTHNG